MSPDTVSALGPVFRSDRKASYLTVSLLVMSFLFAGCLQTREDQKEQEEKQVIRKEVSTLQQSTADTSSRFQDLEDEVRKVNGRVEVLEAKFQQQSVKLDKSHTAADAKTKETDQAFREEFTKISASLAQVIEKMSVLQTQVDELKKTQQARAEAETAKAQSAEKNPLAAAQEHFNKKKWKEAILSYEHYRAQNPNGRSFCSATYKIGLSFQEMGNHEDAKSFFEEVIAKCPKTDDAAKAEARLKKMKK